MFDKEMEKQTADMTQKERGEHIKTAKFKLKQKMDEQLLKKQDAFDESKASNNYDKYWQTWSNAVEQGRLRFLGHKGKIKSLRFRTDWYHTETINKANAM